ncbi:hypothetical protein CCP3SC1AL1_680003 [Gammaproteobacteria bacterium]
MHLRHLILSYHNQKYVYIIFLILFQNHIFMDILNNYQQLHYNHRYLIL